MSPPTVPAAGTGPPATSKSTGLCDPQSYGFVVKDKVRIGGGDTAAPRNLAKRVALLESAVSLRGRRVLDVGCGAGENVEALAERGADAAGVELNPERVSQYLQRHPLRQRVMRGDLTPVPLPDESFDRVVLNEVLEHAPDQMGALREMRRRLGVTQFVIAIAD